MRHIFIDFKMLKMTLNRYELMLKKQALTDFDQFDEISNLCDGSDDKSLIDEVKESEVDLKKFEEMLFPRVADDKQKKN